MSYIVIIILVVACVSLAVVGFYLAGTFRVMTVDPLRGDRLDLILSHYKKQLKKSLLSKCEFGINDSGEVNFNLKGVVNGDYTYVKDLIKNIKSNKYDVICPKRVKIVRTALDLVDEYVNKVTISEVYRVKGSDEVELTFSDDPDPWKAKVDILNKIYIVPDPFKWHRYIGNKVSLSDFIKKAVNKIKDHDR